ncbi:MAG TPA: hypothetical protein VL500_02225 [Candidatus Eisenbacteria bacterium]|nr:hypothetical protein [Candidatus Eisenbacteria bacterium]
MGERPDIGKMIEEELAKGGAPEDGSKPLEIRAGAVGETAEPERMMRPMAPEAKAVDAAAKKEVWEKERTALVESYEKLHAERKGRPKEPKDALTAAELDELRAIIAQAAKENDKVSTSILKEGIAVSDESTLHPYEKGLESMSDKLLDPGGEFYKQSLVLLNMQPDGKEAMKALTKRIQERVEAYAKRTEQMKRLHAPRMESARPAAPAAAETSKPKEMSAEEKSRATKEAMKPFVDDVARMLEGDRRRKAVKDAEKKEEKPKGFWEKWFGKKAA